MVTLVARQILHFDGGSAQGFCPQLVHIKSGAVHQDLIPRVQESAKEVGNHLIAAVAADEIFLAAADILCQGFADVVGHRLGVNLRLEGIERRDELRLDRWDGEHIEIIFIRIDHMLLGDRRHEIGIKVCDRFSKPFSLHRAPP